MKYFIDTEFIEGTQKGWFGKTKPTIDLISIGIISEDNKEYYAISKDFNLKEAWNRYDLKYNTGCGDANNLPPTKVYWIRENVLKPIFDDLSYRLITSEFCITNHIFPKHGEIKFNYKWIKKLIKEYGKTNKQIAEEIYEFCYNDYHKGNNLTFTQRKKYSLYDKFKPEFYGYYSDYDWVVFCWLFGNMMALPKGFPMYCIDLKQTLDEKAEVKSKEWGTIRDKTNCFDIQTHIKTLPNYPKQTNEHNALADARFNYNLYKFLKTI